MMIPKIQDREEYLKQKNSEAVLFYFSHDECNVCKVLKPKVRELLQEKFPKMNMFYVDIRHTPEVAGQESVFTVPTISVVFDGKETIRKSRNIGIEELSQSIRRPYELFFGA